MNETQPCTELTLSCESDFYLDSKIIYFCFAIVSKFAFDLSTYYASENKNYTYLMHK